MNAMNYIFGSQYFRNIEEGNEREWMLSNGLGGYASSTIIGGGSRVHHGYLVAATNPPTGRQLIFTRTQEKIKVASKTYDLTSQRYINNNKDGHKYLTTFKFDGLPTYSYRVENIQLEKTICLEYNHNTVVVGYEVKNRNQQQAIEIEITPLFNYKEDEWYNNKDRLKFDITLEEDYLYLTPHENKQTTITFYKSEGDYFDRSLIPTNMTTPNYVYEEDHFYQYESANGKTSLDTHFTPYDIKVRVEPNETKKFYVKCTIEQLNHKDGFEIIEEERKRQQALIEMAGYTDELAQKLCVSADQFISKRHSTGLKTILAGYPWFGDWGRDTMIAFNGIALATKRYEDAKEILESFSVYVKNGLIPNLFSEAVGDLAYNTVDASLWYFYAVDMYLKHTNDYTFVKEKLYDKLKSIIQAYKEGTDFSIGMDTDGLIKAGDGTWQLTWMDAKIGDWVVTPRHGKPVEVNALWYNALCVMDKLSQYFGEEDVQYKYLAKKVKESFNDKFWNESTGCLYDVVDELNEEIRCNQVWAISLPYTMLPKEKELKVVQVIDQYLYNIYGLRTLSPDDKGFVKSYIGSHFDRDASYHMGTTWAYPIGAFISAYCKVYDYSSEAIKEADQMCQIFLQHLNDGCINGISEIFDGQTANKGKGCFNQAWSVGEVLRAYTEDVLPNKENL